MFIFDSIRRRYVALTPEEWVRQHFVHYLTDVLGYPADLIRNEAQLRIGLQHAACLVDYEQSGYVFLPEIPSYEELTTLIQSNQ